MEKTEPSEDSNAETWVDELVTDDAATATTYAEVTTRSGGEGGGGKDDEKAKPATVTVGNNIQF